MTNWNQLADEKTIANTVAALAANGMKAVVVENGTAAKKKVLALVPEGADVMTMTSVTLDTIGISTAINEGNFKSIRKELMTMDPASRMSALQKRGAAPDWAVGSVHAVTEDGKVLIASASGSQLPAYVYGASHVVWVIGTNKIVKTMDEGMKRIYEHTLPLESERAKKAYGVPGSFVAKLLIMNKEFTPGRITVILVKELLGF